MRVHYDRVGCARGYSMNGREWLFWNNSFAGLLVWAFFALLALPLVAMGALWRSRLPLLAKLAITVGVVAATVAIGTSSSDTPTKAVEPSAIPAPDSPDWYSYAPTPRNAQLGCSRNGGLLDWTPERNGDGYSLGYGIAECADHTLIHIGS